jgi:TonB family protein
MPSLPTGYVGDNPVVVYNALLHNKRSLVKSQYETTAAYRARVSMLLDQINVGGGKTAADRLTFVIFDGEESYNADEGLFTVKVDLNSEIGIGYGIPRLSDEEDTDSLSRDYNSADLRNTARTVGTAVGQNAFGMKRRIKIRAYSALRLVMPRNLTSPWGSAIKFQAEPPEARQASGYVLIALNGHLKYPYIWSDSDVDTATLDDPEEAHTFKYYLFFEPDSLVVYHGRTGQIYGTLDLSEPAPRKSIYGETTVLRPRRAREEEKTAVLEDNKPPTDDHIFSSAELTQKARIISRPEPMYTKEARDAQVSGMVKLRVVLKYTGEVTDVEVLEGLPKGLTEKTIEVAKQIKFVPAMRGGKKVSQEVVLEYNFNLY